VDSEEPVFEAVINWVKHAKKEREESLPDLLQYVRMPLLTPRYITDVIDAEVSLVGYQDLKSRLALAA
jgi:kelch-like protein 12